MNSLETCYKLTDPIINKYMDKLRSVTWRESGRISRWSEAHKRVVRHKEFIRRALWRRVFAILANYNTDKKQFWRIEYSHEIKHDYQYVIVSRVGEDD